MALAADSYVGAQVCTGCHKDIAAAQTQTRMALTWQTGRAVAEHTIEGSIHYNFDPTPRGFFYSVEMPGRPPLRLPVEAMVGGSRHGLSFLARITQMDGENLERPALIETRYLHESPHNRLALSPGFPEAVPPTYELALGRALTPEFEKKCLDCHASGGVRCESCHGPGKAHVESMAAGKPHVGLAKDAETCAQCHSGFGPVSDPLPEQVLISDQVNALRHSECWIQSSGGLNCLQCHNPHRDNPVEVTTRSAKTCSQCHAVEAATKDRCIECHMPTENHAGFDMVDHWIGVHPERTAKSPHTISPRSKMAPVREQLRMLVVDDAAKLEGLRKRVFNGESFFELARANSADPSSENGGYLGDMVLANLSSPLQAAALALKPGETSGVIGNNGRYILLQRLPRDFRRQANQAFEEGARLKSQGKLEEAKQRFLEALRIYPHFVRALVLLGAVFGEQGDAPRAAGVLEIGARLYPEDAGVQYNLGIAYDALGRGPDAVGAYQRAIEIEPALTAAFQNLGADLLASGQTQRAAEVFRQGLRENPLAAPLYFNLSKACELQNDTDCARRALATATKIDPAIAKAPGR